MSDEVVIVASDRGWYRSDGASDDSPPKDPEPNYAAGDDALNREFRNWFVFDLASVEGLITSIALNLGVPSGDSMNPKTGGYRSNDPSELYELYDVETPIDDLIGGNAGLAAFGDLGSGTFFGSLLMDESQEGEIVSIVLNADAVANANHAHSFQVPWALGGTVPTVSPNGLAEGVFAGSHTVPASNVFLTVLFEEGVPCPWDVNGDGVPDVLDLIDLLSASGSQRRAAAKPRMSTATAPSTSSI